VSRTLALLVLLATPSLAAAHDLRPAVLTLVERGPDATEITLRWRPTREGVGPTLALPDGCATTVLGEASGQRRLRARCGVDRLLREARLELDPFTSDAILRVTRDGQTRTHALDPHHASLLPQPTSARGVLGFGALGVEHIATGADHLCFVLGLLMLGAAAPRRRGALRRVAFAVTAFTLAHSITLALSVLDVVRLPPAGVEAAIAASLVLLGLELLREEDSLTRRHPASVAFAFGLLHGFGFAGALRSVGLPEDALFGSLLAFNLGVEAGQLVFLGVGALLLVGLRRLGPKVRWDRASGYAIGGLGAFWLLERVPAVVEGGIA